MHPIFQRHLYRWHPFMSHRKHVMASMPMAFSLAPVFVTSTETSHRGLILLAARSRDAGQSDDAPLGFNDSKSRLLVIPQGAFM